MFGHGFWQRARTFAKEPDGQPNEKDGQNDERASENNREHERVPDENIGESKLRQEAIKAGLGESTENEPGEAKHLRGDKQSDDKAPAPGARQADEQSPDGSVEREENPNGNENETHK
jgi:hypothetical protein